MRLGATAEVVYVRDGSRETAEATIGGASRLSSRGGQTFERLRGAEFRSLDPGHPQYGGIDGVLVARVDQGSPAQRNGLRAGDVITAVNRKPVRSVEELSRAMQDATGAIALNIFRNNARLFIVIQ